MIFWILIIWFLGVLVSMLLLATMTKMKMFHNDGLLYSVWDILLARNFHELLWHRFLFSWVTVIQILFNSEIH